MGDRDNSHGRNIEKEAERHVVERTADSKYKPIMEKKIRYLLVWDGRERRANSYRLI